MVRGVTGASQPVPHGAINMASAKKSSGWCKGYPINSGANKGGRILVCGPKPPKEPKPSSCGCKGGKS